MDNPEVALKLKKFDPSRSSVLLTMKVSTLCTVVYSTVVYVVVHSKFDPIVKYGWIALSTIYTCTNADTIMN